MSLAADAMQPGGFWTRYRAAQHRLLPGGDGVYEVVDQIYGGLRARFRRTWKRELRGPLPQATLRYYDDVARRALRLASREAEKGGPMSDHARRNLTSTLAVRLPEGATGQTIVDLDVYANVTISQDAGMDQLTKGMPARGRARENWDHNVLHVLLHRAQQSELLLFHEIAVGHAVNLAANRGRVPSRRESNSDYWACSALLLEAVARCADTTTPRLFQLHFERPATIRAALPASLQRVLLVGSHVFWYADVLTRLYLPQNVSASLAVLYRFFVLPSLERLASNGRLRLRHRADRAIHRLFFGEMIPRFRRDPTSFSETDLAVALARLVESVWQ
jgi:hypothetical protein